MADLTKRLPGCDDDCGENGERGKRGKRGPRGHHGKDGHDGREGSVGPTGPAASALDNPAPVPNIVYREADPNPLPPNVYSTWEDTYAAINLVRGRGEIYVQYDSRFGNCVIPPGVWDLTEVVHRDTPQPHIFEPATILVIESGAEIVAPVFRTEAIRLDLICDRFGSDPPQFTGNKMVLEGTHFFNTDPASLPAYVANDFPEIFWMKGPRCQIGGGPAPLLDVAGNGILWIVEGGWLFNGALTDTVGGGASFARIFDDQFNGGGGDFTTFDFPDLIAAGGVFDSAAEHRDRYFSPTFDIATSAGPPWQAFMNELVKVDTSTGPVTVIAPPATSPGERLCVVDWGGKADVNNITIVPFGTDMLPSGIINTADGAKRWHSDGNGRWMLTSSV